jgi:hypothetical protein
MKIVRCATQAELDAALAATPAVEIWLVGTGSGDTPREDRKGRWRRTD